MKILMIAPQPFFEPRGTPISVYQRLQGLSVLGHEVDLLTYPLGQNVAAPGLRIRRIPRLPFIRQIPIGPSWVKVPLDCLMLVQAAWMMSTQRYGAIHTHEEGAFLALALSPLFRTPHVYDMHSSLPRQLANSKFGKLPLVVGIFEWFENLVLKTARVVLTIGHDLEAYVLAKNPKANHLRIENLTVHDMRPARSGTGGTLRAQLGLEQQLCLVYTGNFEPYQGLELLLKSLQLLVRAQADVALVMVGGQPEQIERWRQEARRLGLDGHIIFTGVVPLDEVVHYLDLADILVSPRIEGLSIPLKLYSYLQSGKPTVATRIEAHTQLLDDETAVIVDANPEAFAAGLARLIESPELRREIGQRAQAFARDRFSPDLYLSKLKEAYLSIEQVRAIDEPAPTDAGARHPV